MASFFEAEVYFASVSKWIDNLKIVPIGGRELREQFFGRFPRLSEKISVFLECMIAFLDASWNIDSKKQNLRSFVRIEPTGTMTKPLTTGSSGFPLPLDS
ncbi:hypothetical protein RhiirA5_436312 [Rhizophagus irregularis]|uniref:Uncharacterized protein n=1 Tax=Rhizophagus irregularis TaxID=588596 RepID=A0A2N0NM38_9GLOM|nr:hypothetical protein RhiirA5_436312 [Rhizophagus irregularis]